MTYGGLDLCPRWWEDIITAREFRLILAEFYARLLVTPFRQCLW